MQKRLGRGATGEGGYLVEIVVVALATVEVALGEGVMAVDVDVQGDRGLALIISDLEYAQVVGGVAIGKMTCAQLGKRMERVGHIVNREEGRDGLDREVVYDGVEPERAVGTGLENVIWALTIQPVMKAIMAHTVGHIDIAVPGAAEMAGAAGVGEGDDGVVAGRGEGAGLKATVESQNPKEILRVGGELGREEVGGVETAPDGVVVDARGAEADIIAYGIGVGGGIPCEADAVEDGVDCADAEGAGGGGDVVLIVDANGVGGEGASSGEGLDIVAHRIGTDHAA